MIKLRLRRNLLYLLVYFISDAIYYNIIYNLFYSLFDFDSYYARFFLLPIENIIGGLLIVLYQNISVKKKEKPQFFGHYHEIMEKEEEKIIKNYGKFKNIILIFFSSFFGIYNFILFSFCNFNHISWTADYGISSIQLLSSSFICIYALESKIKKHHKISLIFITIFLCLFILVDIIFEIYYSHKNFGAFIFQYFLTLYIYTGFSFRDCTEAYLVSTNYMNPFNILILEGIFQLIIEIIMIFLFHINPFENFKNSYAKLTLGKSILFIFLFVLDLILLLIINVYRIYCNVIYSPMARSLIKIK